MFSVRKIALAMRDGDMSVEEARPLLASIQPVASVRPLAEDGAEALARESDSVWAEPISDDSPSLLALARLDYADYSVLHDALMSKDESQRSVT
jgi:hypothetical protein